MSICFVCCFRRPSSGLADRCGQPPELRDQHRQGTRIHQARRLLGSGHGLEARGWAHQYDSCHHRARKSASVVVWSGAFVMNRMIEIYSQVAISDVGFNRQRDTVVWSFGGRRLGIVGANRVFALDASCSDNSIVVFHVFAVSR